MPTNRPRIQVTLDEDTGDRLSMLAAGQGRPLSATAAELIRQALDLQEDMYLSQASEARLAGDDGRRITHEDAWR